MGCGTDAQKERVTPMKRKSFPISILFALCVVALPAISQNLQNQQEQMRFQGMDRNRDGVITRTEWRGNDRSFANEDWNGDGVLSGDEVRPGARRVGELLSSERNAARFRDLDRNNDGVITRTEWRDDRRAFDRLDTSRNGMLNRDEFFSRNDERSGRFADLDRNNDAVIARNEWDDDRQAFDGLDANRNGVLSRNEYFASGDGRAGNELRGAPKIISSGTEFAVRSNETIDSKTATVGQHFSALIERDILDSTGALAIPKGSNAELVIRQTEDGGITNASELVLDVDSVTVAGISYLVSTEDIGEQGRDGIGANRRTGVMVGGGAGLGALIGAIAGGGKGAAIGAGVGAAAGAAGQILTKGGEVRVPAETVLNFKLERDLYLEPAR